MNSATETKQEKKKNDQVTVLGASNFTLPSQKLDMDEELQEPTLEEKVRELTVVEEKVVQEKGVPKVNSLQQMLLQALRTNDSSLLEQCLAVRFLFFFFFFFFFFSFFLYFTSSNSLN